MKFFLKNDKFRKVLRNLAVLKSTFRIDLCQNGLENY